MATRSKTRTTRKKPASGGIDRAAAGIDLEQLGELLTRMESLQRVMAGPAVDAATSARLQLMLQRLASSLPVAPPAFLPAPSILLTPKPSGPDWVAEFPGSRDPADCVEPFKANLTAFLSALAAARAAVRISATLRPVQRAYLMHWSWMIAKNLLDPASAPARADVPIQWVHLDGNGQPDLAKSRSAARQMVDAYGIVTETSAPALASRHTEGLAVDMTITWAGSLTITDADGTARTISDEPRDGMNGALQACGKTYGVIKAKFAGDPPHWSSDGH